DARPSFFPCSRTRSNPAMTLDLIIDRSSLAKSVSLSLLEGTVVIGVVLPAAGVIGVRRLQILFTQLVLVPLMPSDTATNHPEHPVARHMARQGARSSP